MKLRRFLKLEDHGKMFYDDVENDYSTARSALEQWEKAILDSQILEITIMRGEELFTFEIMELNKGQGE